MRQAHLFLLAIVYGCFPLSVDGQTRSDGRATEESPGSPPAPGRALDLMESHARAAELLARAVSASGGSERLKSLTAIRLDFEAQVAATFQGSNPSDPHRMLRRTGKLVLDLAGDKLVSRSETHWPNFTALSHLLYREGHTHDLDERTSTFRSAEDDEVLQAWKLRLMPVLLRQLSDRTMSLRYEGLYTMNGRQHEVVSSPLDDGQVYRFYFSPLSDLPEVIENLHYSSEFGDIVVKREYSDFRTIAGITFPTAVQMSYNGHEIFSYRLANFATGADAMPQDITIPASYRPAADDQPVPRMQTRKLAEHVHLIEHLAGRDYNVMFADLGEFLMVFEAPIDTWASRIVLAEVRKVFPDKPLRYVMVSHFHDDHAAGVRTYMAEGASVITTPENREYFGEVARLRHTFHAENDLLAVAEPKLEIVRDGFHEIGGSNLVVQFLDFGPTSHVDENLIAYLPNSGILFQGDYFRVPADRDRPERLRDEGLVLLEGIKQQRLAVTRLVGVHGPVGDLSDLEKAYELRLGSDSE